ncbi:hypothetical protein [Flexibacterium corallicola]|uniref:hypothetical protein n=1 Tax=Flexibacterium corallicola TaxID=3037259 RepID=UPI00286F2705|nr:hypothetical protein [Pseudovibrio sp. M1P-2-3]
MDWIVYFIENWAVTIEALLAIVGVFAIIATKTANSSDDAIVDTLYKIINFLGANVGKATNDPAIDRNSAGDG